MAPLRTADICDGNLALMATGELRSLQPIFRMYGRVREFAGPIVTLKLVEDENVSVRRMLEGGGDGKVLVIDGGGSTRTALMGGTLAELARSRGWSGIVVNGCIRDVDEINECDIGIRALGSQPGQAGKKVPGEKHVPLFIGGAFIHDGEWLYADADGVVVSKTQLSL